VAGAGAAGVAAGVVAAGAGVAGAAVGETDASVPDAPSGVALAGAPWFADLSEFDDLGPRDAADCLARLSGARTMTMFRPSRRGTDSGLPIPSI
jgi:hypothetical protein